MNFRFTTNFEADKTLFESEDFLVSQKDELIHLNSGKPWSKEHLKLVEKYRVNSLQASPRCFGERTTADFLLDLPALRYLHIVVNQPTDLSAISKLTDLEYLGLMGKLVRNERDTTTPSFDLTKLTKLRRAYVQLCRPIKSLLKCSSLESIWLWDEAAMGGLGPGSVDLDLQALTGLRELKLTQWPKLECLDLTAQSKLERLHLQALPKLSPGKLTFHPKAKLKSLKIGGCGSYRIDWERIGASLQELELIGPLRFPLEEVLQAPNLRRLSTDGVRKFPPLNFLLGLKQLREFSRFTPPPGPKFSKEDLAVIQQINERKR